MSLYYINTWIILNIYVIFIGSIFVWYFFNEATHITISDDFPDRIITSSPDNIFVFMQVTDIHISHNDTTIKNDNKNATKRFRTFCTDTVKMINPELVIMSGDICGDCELGNFNFKSTFSTYQSIIQNSDLYRSDYWLDIRGNHDSEGAFNFYSDKNNIFRQYGVNGKKRVYSLTKNTNFGKYRFVMFDSNNGLHSGSHLGGSGILSGFFIDGISEQIKHLLTDDPYINGSILSSHYPFWEFPITFEQTLMNICKESPSLRAYLPGHNHQDYERQRMPFHNPTFYEIQLGSLRDTRTYRVLAFDNDILSMTDQYLLIDEDQQIRNNQNQSNTCLNNPIILITNPKDARLLSPREPLKQIATSTHIRVLSWSQNNITLSIKAKIEGVTMELYRIEDTPLYVAPWEASYYKNNIHLIEVWATDNTQNCTTHISQYFSLDGSLANIGHNFFQIIEAIGIHLPFLLLFIILVISCILILLLPRLCGRSLEFEKKCIIGHKRDILGCGYESISQYLFTNFWRLSNISNNHFVTLFIFCINTAIGPVLIGPFAIRNIWGGMFSWGVIIESQATLNYFPPIPLCFILAYIYIPFIFLFAYYDTCMITETTPSFRCCSKKIPINCWTLWMLTLSLFFSFLLLFIFIDSYGWLCSVFFISVTWFLIIHLPLLLRSIFKLNRNMIPYTELVISS